MELPPTLQETSMWRVAPQEDWMVTPVQAAVTSSWLSTTPVVQSSGRSSWAHPLMIMLMVSLPTPPETYT